MSRDEIYRKNLSHPAPFQFDEEVAVVFDDMAERSIPFYSEVARMSVEILLQKLPQNPRILDLGCSTGKILALISHIFQKERPEESLELIGIDNSPSMIKYCQQKLNAHGVKAKLLNESLEEIDLPQADAIIMNYTLQFVPVKKRQELLEKISHSLRPGGVFILSEKLRLNDGFSSLFTDLYYRFKKNNGYTELEISQKREALEDVLVPQSYEEHTQSFQEAGLDHSECFFRWYNFASFIAIKS